MNTILKASDVKGTYKPTKEDLEKVRMKLNSFKLSGDWVFHTIQGEGNWIGKPTTFVRLHFCNLKCSWCFSWNTPVMMSDWTKKSISEIKKGDKVYSHKDQKIQISGVEKTHSRLAKVVSVITETGDRITCTPDHVFYVNRRTGKSKSTRCKAINLKWEDIKLFLGFPKKLPLTQKYKKGYLKGAYVGDGHIWADKQHLQFQLCDKEFIDTVAEIMNENGANVSVKESSRKTNSGKVVYRVSSGKKILIDYVLSSLETKEDWLGYVAWFFDAEGCVHRNAISMSQKDQNVLNRIKEFLESEGIIVGEVTKSGNVHEIRITWKTNIFNFYKVVPVQITRKIPKDNRQVLANVKVVDVLDEGKEEMVYDISTTLWNFFAHNFQVENCDTWYTRHGGTKNFYTEPSDVEIEKLHDVITKAQQEAGVTEHVYNVTFTWGEPMLQQDKIIKFMQAHPKYTVQIETNGTLMPKPYLVEHAKFNCSPKLLNSDNPLKVTMKTKAIEELIKTKDICFKFVAKVPEDIDEVLKNYSMIPKEYIYIMPEGVTKEENTAVYEVIAEKIIAEWLNSTPRLQNVMFDGAKRGV